MPNDKSTNKRKSKVNIFRRQKKTKEAETTIISKLQDQYQNIVISQIVHFTDFPLSEKTLKGLKENDYTEPTEIQRESIALSLRGVDILGAANTGSGKTLAFLIPVLETLFCHQWTHFDGLGALIITPTRELAYQIFETLRKVGIYHDFSAGLIIGGKDLHFEKKRMDQCNIVICTPGRLLQHMDENPLFDCVNMKILVLDEADRCLDMGFQETMNAIIENLPETRQTLLFSATQTKSVKDLGRLSLKDPMYVSVHEHAKHSTPVGLQQSYIVCELHEKMSVLWSFIRNHLKHKSIVFLSTCKQVKYVYEIFCQLRPGISLLALYGRMHQIKRMNVYNTFAGKSNAVLFATDIAARGLDFPEVHWVVQADCPEDASTYIHRAGRTARYQKGGESLLILLPSEREAMIKQLEDRKIPISEIKINPSKLQNPQRKMEAFLARNPNLKESAQRAFVSYAKSIFLMKNKPVFDVHALDTNSYATSLGLAVPPRIRFLQKLTKKKSDESATTNLEMKSSDDDENSSESECDEKITKKVDMQGYDFTVPDAESDNDIITLKRSNHEIESELAELPLEDTPEVVSKSKKPLTKAAVAKRLLKKKIVANKKTVFDESGDAVMKDTKEKQSALAQEYENEDAGGIDIEKAKLVLREEDKFDKDRFRQKVKEKHRTEKLKIKEAKKDELDGERDDFGSDEDSDEGPDLSWLPDVDKIYGKNGEDTGSSDGGEYDEDSYENKSADSSGEETRKPTKRKLVTNKTMGDDEKPRKRGKKQVVELSSGLSVNEAEELALKLLGA